jgi:sugar/nucleoside kinase (ribokinase family)
LVVESEPTTRPAEVRERAHLAARSLRAAGARRAVVTAGRHGAAYADDRGDLWWPAPAIEPVNPIGAGDALVGGVADRLLAGAGWRAAVRHGVLVASASVEHPRAGRVDPGRVARLAAVLARNAGGGDQVA